MKSCKVFFSLLLIVCLFSCSDKKEPDLGQIKLEIKIERFDQEMAKFESNNLAIFVPELQKQYGWFYTDYMESMLGVGSTADTAYYTNLKSVLANKDYEALAAEVKSKFPDLKKQEEELTDAFKRIRFYFPKQKLPRVISFLSGFAVQTPIGDDYIGIGLDMFLGADSKFYPALVQSIPQYISRRFTPENIRPRVLETFIREDLFPERDADRSLLDKMVYNGKILYLMDSFMPDLADSTKIGFTGKQEAWCAEHEADIWAYFLDESLLYETDYLKIQKFLAEAPFTPGLGDGNESAPKLGVWIGWQIVRKYMDKNPELSLAQLMAEPDAQKILRASKYKPK